MPDQLCRTNARTIQLLLVSAILLLAVSGAPAGVVTCRPDLDRNGQVDVSDLLELLAHWGPCPREGECKADLTGDGNVDVGDLLVILGAWGACELEGGCVGFCGEASPFGWCDENCVTFGDCVWNACAACALPTCSLLPSDSCQYRCGGMAPDGCWCDEMCCDFADCCADIDWWCGGCP